MGPPSSVSGGCLALYLTDETGARVRVNGHAAEIVRWLAKHQQDVDSVGVGRLIVDWGASNGRRLNFSCRLEREYGRVEVGE